MEGFMIDRALVATAAASESRYAYKEILVAEREFRRARRRAWARWLGLVRGASPIIRTWEKDESRVSVDSIAGLEGEDGMPTIGIPPMPPALLREWCSLYLRMGGEDADWQFELRSRDGSWYLAGGGAALVRLELMRMRGAQEVRAKLEDAAPLCDEGPAAAGGCCEGRLGAA